MALLSARTVLTVSLCLNLLFVGLLAVGWVRGLHLPPLPPGVDARVAAFAMRKVVLPSIRDVMDAHPETAATLEATRDDLVAALRATPFNEAMAEKALTELSRTHGMIRDEALPLQLTRVGALSDAERLMLADMVASARIPFFGHKPEPD